MSPKLQAFGIAWHQQHSPAFYDVLINPLKPYINIQFNAWHNREDSSALISSDPIILCQVFPPKELLDNRHSRIIWIPMWDDVRWWRQRNWDAITRENLRVVAFSEQIANHAVKAGISTLKLQYFKDPDLFPNRHWNERVLLYWNRTGLINPKFLDRLCAALEVDRLIFRPVIDPKVPSKLDYSLPSKLGRTLVEQMPISREHNLYLEELKQANIFIAPRQFEGIGMSFLEALASGCAVFAYNAPTMNEYITSQEDGFLFKRISKVTPRSLMRSVQGRLAKKLKIIPNPSVFRSLPIRQDWELIQNLSIEKLGASARERHINGFQQWDENLTRYAQFIGEW